MTPFWIERTRGWERSEEAAAEFLAKAWARALSEGRHHDADAIRREMTTS